jgi:soluble lytic murein transglycosylase
MLQLRSDIHFLTGGLIAESQDYLSSCKYLYEALDRKEILFNRQLLEMLYPTPYLNDLKSTLKSSGFDPIIVLSLIRQESVFNPEARSPVGARGLMQLMPATAKRFQRSVREKQLVQPKRNMEIGTKYFQQLMKRFDGNLVYVLASYNAGENRVDRWKTTYFNEDETILKNIEMIPFLETRNYVKLIFRNIFFYKLLIDGEQEQVNPELNKIYNVALGFKK